MGRYITDIQPAADLTHAVSEIEKYLISEGFEKTIYKGEEVWKKGKGVALGPQFIKLVSADGSVHIEAWIKMAPLPGLYVGETGIHGLFGAVPKKQLKKRVDHIEQFLRSDGAADVHI